MKFYAERIVVFEQVCWCVGLGRGWHGSVGLQVVVPERLGADVDDPLWPGRGVVEFPLIGWTLYEGPGKFVVAREADDRWIDVYEVWPGYRGSGRVRIIDPEGVRSWKFPLYRSQVGSLGIGDFQFPLRRDIC